MTLQLFVDEIAIVTDLEQSNNGLDLLEFKVRYAIQSAHTHRNGLCLEIVGLTNRPVQEVYVAPEKPVSTVEELEKTARLSSYINDIHISLSEYFTRFVCM